MEELLLNTPLALHQIANALNISVELLKTDLSYYITLYAQEHLQINILMCISSLLPFFTVWFGFYYYMGRILRELKGKALACYTLKNALPIFIIGNVLFISVIVFFYYNDPTGYANNVIINLINNSSV